MITKQCTYGHQLLHTHVYVSWHSLYLKGRSKSVVIICRRNCCEIEHRHRVTLLQITL